MSANATHTFRLTPSLLAKAICKRWLLRYWWTVGVPVFALIMAALLLNRWEPAVGALMIVFTIVPIVFSFTYFRYMLKDEVRMSILPHIVKWNAEGNITVESQPDETFAYRFKPLHIAASKVSAFSRTKQAINISYNGGAPHQLIIIPIEAFTDEAALEKFSNMCENNVCENFRSKLIYQ